MKIEISPNKIAKDVLTIWPEPGPDVDIVMDLKKLTFKENSVDTIYSYHVLDHLFPQEILPTILNWTKCLKSGGEIFFVIDDFEFICRYFVGGEITIDDFNQNFTHPCYFTKENIISYLSKAGYNENLIKIWFADIPEIYIKKDHELIISAQKNDKQNL